MFFIYCLQTPDHLNQYFDQNDKIFWRKYQQLDFETSRSMLWLWHIVMVRCFPRFTIELLRFTSFRCNAHNFCLDIFRESPHFLMKVFFSRCEKWTSQWSMNPTLSHWNLRASSSIWNNTFQIPLIWAFGFNSNCWV